MAVQGVARRDIQMCTTYAHVSCYGLELSQLESRSPSWLIQRKHSHHASQSQESRAGYIRAALHLSQAHGSGSLTLVYLRRVRGGRREITQPATDAPFKSQVTVPSTWGTSQ
jgi:hypothetical protein